jgi:hypothetical protein
MKFSAQSEQLLSLGLKGLRVIANLFKTLL